MSDVSPPSPHPTAPLESDLIREVRTLIAGLSSRGDGVSHHDEGVAHPTGHSTMFVSAMSSPPDQSTAREDHEELKDEGAVKEEASGPNIVYFTAVPHAERRPPPPSGDTTTANTTLDESAIAGRYREALRRHVAHPISMTDGPTPAPRVVSPSSKPGANTHGGGYADHFVHHASHNRVSSTHKAAPHGYTDSVQVASSPTARSKRRKGDDGALWMEKAEAQGLLIDILQRDLVHQDAALRRLEEQTSRQRVEMRTAVAHHALERDEWRKQLAELSTELSRVRTLLKGEVDAGLQETLPLKHPQHPSYIKVYDELQQTKGHNMALRQRILELEVSLREKDATTRNAIREMQLHQQCLVAGIAGTEVADPLVDGVGPSSPPATGVVAGDGTTQLVMTLLRRLVGGRRDGILSHVLEETNGGRTTPSRKAGPGSSSSRRRPSSRASPNSRRASPFRNCH